MDKLNIKPHVGVGKIRLGMNKIEVNQLLGEPLSYEEDIEYYFNNFLQISYDEKNEVEFIEIFSSINFDVEYNGIQIFNSTAKEVIEKICEFQKYDENDPELGYSYIFKNIDLSLYRSVVPENDEDKEGKYFSTIGIGIKGYWEEY